MVEDEMTNVFEDAATMIAAAGTGSLERRGVPGPVRVARISSKIPLTRTR